MTTKFRSRRVIVDRDVAITMRDGVELATDVYRLEDAIKSPTVVQRTPYSKSNARLAGDLLFNPLVAAEAGFAVVIQDVRGRYASEGMFEPFVNEIDDGWDTVEWAASQPWSNGNVGLCGASFVGANALLGAVSAPPHLKACLTYLTGANFHDGFIYSGGAFELGFSLRLARVLASDTVGRLAAGSERDALSDGLRRLGIDPWAAVRQTPVAAIEALAEPAAPYWANWCAHPAYDNYWKEIDVVARAHEINVPLLHVTGWFDIFLRGHLDLAHALAEHPSDRVREQSRLIIGPWDHGAYMSLRPTTAGVVEFGPIATSGASLMSTLSLAWFGKWLREEAESPDVPKTKVRYFTIGPNHWNESESWPPTNTRDEWLFLHSGGKANTRSGDGLLSSERPGSEPPDQFEYDPTDPVPTVGGRTMHPELGPAGIQNQDPIEDRRDVLVYTSATLTRPVTVNGPISMTLYASSTAEDTDFTAKLVDVDLEGRAWIIAEGIRRVRYREGDDQEQLLADEEIAQLTIDLWDTSYRFAVGHAVRLEVSSSNFPKYDRHTNTPDNPLSVKLGNHLVCTQKVFHDATTPSCLKLAVMGNQEMLLKRPSDR